ncbi:MAG: 1-acyl-sn-glycerol-3-phosphate acyltransferase [Oscillospiraceae bacterium]|nr:1-acyl-sn-glycerol-3-phosphate acyltransferase [Oscillospiraceae bacterium]
MWSIIWAFLRYFVLFFYKIYYNLKFEGTENIPHNGGHIFASNHRSNADPVFLTLKVPARFSYMAKKELFEKNFFVTCLIIALGAYPVDRGKGDTGAIDTAIEKLKIGKNFMIFPEGQRSKDGKVGKGKSGIALIAAKAQTDVIPVGIIFDGKLKFRRKVIIRYGKPIPPEKLAVSDPPQKTELKALVNTVMGEIEHLVYKN